MGRPKKERVCHRDSLSRDDREYFETIDAIRAKREELGIRVNSNRFMPEYRRKWIPDEHYFSIPSLKKRKHDEKIDEAFRIFYASGCSLKKSEIVAKSGISEKVLESAFSKAGINFTKNSDRD